MSAGAEKSEPAVERPIEPSGTEKYTDRLALWDSRTNSIAPLTELQKQTTVELSTYTKRAWPKKFARNRMPSESTPDDDELSKHIASLDLGTRKVENAQQFFSWFTQVQSQMEQDQEQNYRTYHKELSTYCTKCDDILKEVHKVLTHLEKLQSQHLFVSTQTRALHDACEQSLQDQATLMNQAEGISDRLSYFNAYDTIKHKLSSSTLSVTGESFIPLLSKIDECIEYIDSHPEYKESSVYLARFKICLNQALSLVKQYVTNILRSACNQAQASMNKDHHVSTDISESSYTSLYGKFKAQSGRVKAVMEQMERRTVQCPEYQSIVDDCQQCFLEYRWQLLSPVVSETIANLVKQHSKNPCTLFRSGCSFMVHVCHDEYQLYYEFFTKGKVHLDLLLENLCGLLYDAFRPLVIYMNHMETLAEICNILKVEMLEDHVQRKADELASFEVVISPMMQDVQERLVYRTQTYINVEIAGYSPAPGDLAYPEKLMMDIGSSENMNGSADNSSSKSDRNTAVVDLQAMWYPTVRRTLVCLSKLYNCIGKPTFEGIAQEALSVCIQTLKSASVQITKKKGSMNGHLFLVKHLLILREQISPFDVDFAIKEVSLDFSKMRSAAADMFSRPKQMFHVGSSNAILEFLLEGLPQLTEYYLDSKKEVDTELKQVCEQFINDVTDSFIAPLLSLLDTIDTILKMAEEEGKEQQQLLKKQPFARADNIRKVVSETYMLLKSKLSSTIQSLSLFLANKDTEYILFKPIKAKVLRAYRQLTVIVDENYTDEDQQIIGCPSQEQVSLLMTFS